MGGMGSGRFVTLKPGSKAAARILAILLAEGGPTSESIAKALDCSLSAWTLYLKGKRACPLWLAVAVRRKFRIPVEEWLEKAEKVLAPGHGFNSERSKQSENGGRP